MISTSHQNALRLICRGVKEHKKKIILAGLLCGAFILYKLHFTEAKPPEKPVIAVKENENLEDELNDRNTWELDEPANKPPTNLDVSN